MSPSPSQTPSRWEQLRDSIMGANRGYRQTLVDQGYEPATSNIGGWKNFMNHGQMGLSQGTPPDKSQYASIWPLINSLS